THYQELTKLEGIYDSVRNYCVTVRESGKKIIFFHRVMPGVANKSYGIEVARLAGVPYPVIERAREILKRLERKQLNLTGSKRSSTVPDRSFEDVQKGLF
ncbi:MAG TPA: DNA mismatch repair protein MutS, partial [Acidobacteriota bacterium]|nr:DNA mismatch repair protein MutS [Acidobacteriota bacterium]